MSFPLACASGPRRSPGRLPPLQRNCSCAYPPSRFARPTIPNVFPSWNERDAEKGGQGRVSRRQADADGMRHEDRWSACSCRPTAHGRGVRGSSRLRERGTAPVVDRACFPTPVAYRNIRKGPVTVEFPDETVPALSQILGSPQTGGAQLLFGFAGQGIVKNPVDCLQDGVLCSNLLVGLLDVG